MQRPEERPSSADWELHFDPRSYSKELDGVSLEDRGMPIEELEHFGVLVSKQRKELHDYASQYDVALADSQGLDVSQISSLPQRTTHGYFSAIKGLSKYQFGYIGDELLPGQQRKRDGKKQLSLDERIAIAHKVIVEQETYDVVGGLYSVSNSVISHIIKKVTSNHSYFSDLIDIKNDKLNIRRKI